MTPSTVIATAALFAFVAPVAAAPTPAPTLAGNVLVWIDAPLYLDALDASASIRLGQLAHGRDQDVGQVVPMHVVGGTDEFVEVEPTADIECVWWRVTRPDGLASLRLFVKRTDLAPVVTNAVSVAFKDGSRIALQPGVPVVAGTVAFLRNVVHAAIPDANLGASYRPHAIADVDKPDKHTFLVDEHTRATLGGEPFDFGPWVAATALRRGDRMLVTIAARCATAVISVPRDHVQADVRLGQGIGYGTGRKGISTSNADRYYLPVATKLTSEAGDHVVATLAAEVDVAKPTGARACADFVVTHDEPIIEAPQANEAARPDRTLHLCAPADRVKLEQRSRY